MLSGGAARVVTIKLETGLSKNTEGGALILAFTGVTLRAFQPMGMLVFAHNRITISF